jgi:predicted patatin/cPLA2 family phospholipase
MKIGLVLEGGASRSLFSCGVMDALLKEKIYAQYVIGVSAGIAYGTSYVSRQEGRNLELSLKYMHDSRYMGTRHIFNPKNRSYYNMDFVFRQIPEKLVPFDFEEFQKNSRAGSSVAVLTNMYTGKAEYIKLADIDWTQHLKVLWASCALPILFQPEKIGESLYMDGGISDPIPFKKAFEDGCDKVITVLTRERGYEKRSDTSAKLASRVYKRYPQFADALVNRPQKYNEDRNDLFEMEKNNKVFVIAPTDTSNFSRTERRPEKLKAMYDDGYATTKKVISELKKYLES